MKNRLGVNSTKLGRTGVKTTARNSTTGGAIRVSRMRSADKTFRAAALDSGEKFCNSPAPTVERLRVRWWTESPWVEWIKEIKGLYRKQAISKRHTNRRTRLESASGRVARDSCLEFVIYEY